MAGQSEQPVRVIRRELMRLRRRAAALRAIAATQRRQTRLNRWSSQTIRDAEATQRARAAESWSDRSRPPAQTPRGTTASTLRASRPSQANRSRGSRPDPTTEGGHSTARDSSVASISRVTAEPSVNPRSSAASADAFRRTQLSPASDYLSFISAPCTVIA